MTFKKNILIAPLNWGIGHATRCVPIIKQLISKGFNPIIASDGDALQLLQQEFPKLKSITLPSYNITYPKRSEFLKLKLLLNLPHVLKTIQLEEKIVEKLITSENLTGIISDNRFGVYSSKIPSVYITHQLNVLSGITTLFTSKIHQKYIQKFDECWIPDINSEENLTGKLSKYSVLKNQKFIGVLSRFTKKNVPKKYDLLILLSGIESARSRLEKKLLFELKNYAGNVLFISGKITEKQEIKTIKNWTYCNFLLTDTLEQAINQSKMVICRSGYSTIMDLAILGKKAFFIPTTGQTEQEYLAKHLKQLKIAPFATEKEFKIELLKKVKNYSGFNNIKFEYKKIDFSLFE